MEIKSLLIENFQSHKQTKIEPAPAGQLTVITGLSHKGKTAILRALRWLYYNYPQGTKFIRVGAREATVVLTLADGTKIIRNHSRGSKNSYEIEPPDGEKQTFAGFGVNVPLEVQQITGVRPVQIGDLELNLNLAEQLDGPFLGKSISAGARAKVLGKLAGTEEVDYAGKQLVADLHRRGQDEKRLAAEIAGLKEAIQGFDYLPAMQARIKQAEMRISRAKAAAEQRDMLAAYLESLRQCEAGISQTRAIIFSWRGLGNAEFFLTGIERKAGRNEKLRWLAGRLKAAEEGISACRGIMQKWAELEEAANALTGADKAMARKSKLKQLDDQLFMIGVNEMACRQVLQRWANLDEGAIIILRAAEMFERCTNIKGLRYKFVDVNKQIARAYLTLDRLQHLEAALCYAETANTWLTHRKLLLPLAARLDQADKRAETARQQTVLHENRVAELEGAYNDALVAAGRCPLCGSKLKIKGGQINNLREVV